MKSGSTGRKFLSRAEIGATLLIIVMLLCYRSSFFVTLNIYVALLAFWADMRLREVSILSRFHWNRSIRRWWRSVALKTVRFETVEIHFFCGGGRGSLRRYKICFRHFTGMKMAENKVFILLAYWCLGNVFL